MDWYSVLVSGHIIGTALGVGGATISDYLFFKSVKDGKITAGEFSFLKAVSRVLWLGFLILVFSGFGLLFLWRLNAGAGELVFSSKFLAKMTVVSIIFFNGLLMHWKVFPLFEAGLNKPLNSEGFSKKIPLVYSTGVISIVSWYSAMLLGSWREMRFSYPVIMIFYVFLILAGLVMARFVVRKIIFKK
ncbi:MAG: hypothetical protein UV43_C0054G0006 [Parcubacteria group bacterium GW2011_GWF2_42_7]|nr:MAG: hypothetical protein UV43_C0054G0006 [Parcubacteria group bacterium GW2011_GWF2_42_7]